MARPKNYLPVLTLLVMGTNETFFSNLAIRTTILQASCDLDLKVKVVILNVWPLWLSSDLNRFSRGAIKAYLSYWDICGILVQP